jgi:hypothetical protein
VASYKLNLPFDLLFRRNGPSIEGWSLAGTTRFSTGLPVTLYDDSDNSLLGTLGNGINNYLLDTPNSRLNFGSRHSTCSTMLNSMGPLRWTAK